LSIAAFGQSSDPIILNPLSFMPDQSDSKNENHQATKVFNFNGKDPSEGITPASYGLVDKNPLSQIGLEPAGSGLIGWSVVSGASYIGNQACKATYFPFGDYNTDYPNTCDFTPVFSNGQALNVNALSSGQSGKPLIFKSLFPWNVSFSSDGSESLIAATNSYNSSSTPAASDPVVTVYLGRNMGGGPYDASTMPAVSQIVHTYPFDQKLSSLFSLFTYGKFRDNIPPNQFYCPVLYDSKSMMLHAGCAEVVHEISGGLLDHSYVEMFINDPGASGEDAIGQVVNDSTSSLEGMPISVTNISDITKSVNTETTKYQAIKSGMYGTTWPAGIYMIKALSQVQTTSDVPTIQPGSVASPSTVVKTTTFGNFTDQLSPTLVKTNNGSFTTIQQTVLGKINYGIDATNAMTLEVPLESYAFRLNSDQSVLNPSDAPLTAPMITQASSSAAILSAAKTTWSSLYPGRKTSDIAWLDRPVLSGVNVTNPQAPAFSLAAQNFHTVANYHYNNIWQLDGVTRYPEAAHPMRSTTLYGGTQELPMVVVDGAGSGEVAALLGDNFTYTYPFGEVGVHLADAGDASHEYFIIHPDYYVIHSGTASVNLLDKSVCLLTDSLIDFSVRREITAYKISGWIYTPVSNAVQNVSILLNDANGAQFGQIIVSPTPSNGTVKANVWQKWEATLKIPSGLQGKYRVAAFVNVNPGASSAGIFLDDFVLAPANAIYSINGYDSYGQQISSAPQGDNVVWTHYSTIGFKTGVSAPNSGRMLNESVAHRPGEDAQ